MMQDEKDKLLTLFENESKWCQHVEARDKRGNPVHYSDESAVAWDMVGGLCILFGWERACELFVQVERRITGVKQGHGLRDPQMAAMASLQDFNDKRGTTYDLVMTRLREMPVHDRKVPELSPL
jgi:hypothetical protein